MEAFISSIEAEYRRYKALADAAMNQLSESELNKRDASSDNSVAIIAWHVGGNLKSRFTDFLTTDGEKPWRNREEEFARKERTYRELQEHWNEGWDVLFKSLSELTDNDLKKTITIRGTELKVHEALHRSLAHTSYHVGQIVYVAKALCGPEWNYLSIAPGQSKAYNENPTSEHANAHAERLEDKTQKT